MAWIVVNKKGRQMLSGEYDTQPEAEQALLDLIYGAMDEKTPKGAKKVVEYMTYGFINKKPTKSQSTLPVVAEKESTRLAVDNKSLVVSMIGQGNPDFQQYVNVTPLVNKPCETLRQASELCQEFISWYNLGGGNWGNQSGLVYHPTKGLIAKITYNGRVWDGKNQRQEILEADLDKTYKEL